MIKAFLGKLSLTVFLAATTLVPWVYAQTDAITISAFELRGGKYIPVSGEIVGTNSVTLLFSANVQTGALEVRAPVQSPVAGYPVGTIVQVFDSGTVTASLLDQFDSANPPLVSTNFFVRVENSPPLVTVKVQDRVGSRPVDITSPDAELDAADYADITISRRFPSGTIFYTTDGTEPNVLSRRYYGTTKLMTDTDFRAIVYSSDFSQSVPVRFKLHIVPALYLRIGNAVEMSANVLSRPDAMLSSGLVWAPSNAIVRLQNTNVPAGSVFLGWVGFTNSTNAQIDLVLNRNREIYQLLESTNEPTVGVVPTAHGTVIQGGLFKTVNLPATPGVSAPGVRQITAVPDAGYFFLEYRNLAQPISFPQLLYFAPRVEPVFAPLPPGYHSLVLEGDGLVTFTPLPQYAFADGAEVVVTATPYQEFIFTGWSGAATGTNPTIRVKMDGDKRLVAHTTHLVNWTGRGKTPAAVGESGLVYTTGDSLLKALNKYGLSEWEVPFPLVTAPPPGGDPTASLSYPVLGPGERIYVGANAETWAFDKTGRNLWRAPVGASRLAVSSNGVFTLTAGGDIARLSFAGSISARTNLNFYVTAFALTPKGEPLVAGYFPSGLPRLTCYDDSFRELWHRNNAGQQNAPFESLVVRKDGLILGAGWETVLLDQNGNVRWTNSTGTLYSQAVAASTNLFFVYEMDTASGTGTRLSAFAADGSRSWTHSVGGPSRLGSAVALEDGSVLSAVPVGEGLVVRRFSLGGDLVWELPLLYSYGFPQSSPVWPTPNLVVGPQGNLYILADNGSVFGTSNIGTPANSGWPMWFGDWRNAGLPEPLPGSTVPSELGLFLSVDLDYLTLTVSAPPDTPWVLQGSADLVDWNNISITGDQLEIPIGSTGRAQFFRVLRR